MAALTPYIPSRLSRRTEPFGELSLSEFEVVASMDEPPSECMQYMGQQQSYSYGSFDYWFSFSYSFTDFLNWMFTEFDADGSGGLNLAELMTAIIAESPTVPPESVVQCAFGMHDVDGNGELSLEEFAAFVDGFDESVSMCFGSSYSYGSFEYAFSFSFSDMDPAALFGQFDADGSASLNLGEFQVLINSGFTNGGPDYPMEFISCAFNFLDTQGRCWRAFTHAGDV